MTDDKKQKEEVQILDFDELLQFIEKRLAASGMSVGRDEIITILQAEEAFLMEKGVLIEVE